MQNEYLEFTIGDRLLITPDKVSQWVGKDFTRDDFIKLLVDLANGDYLAEHLANDIEWSNEPVESED